MLSDEMIRMINEQIGREYYSAYLYLQISIYFEARALFGFERWYKIQAKEECTHAGKFINYLQDNDAPVELPAIDKPVVGFPDNGAPLRKALEHERYITDSINAIAVQAKKDDDFRTAHFLNWFQDEQLEDEKQASDLLKKFQHFGSETKGLVVLDEELGQRNDGISL